MLVYCIAAAAAVTLALAGFAIYKGEIELGRILKDDRATPFD